MGLRIFSYLVVRLNLSFLKTSDFHYCIFVVVAFWVLFEAKTKQQKLVICIFNL